MAKSDIAAATSSLYETLQPLTEEDRLKVVEAVLVLFGQSRAGAQPRSPARTGGGRGEMGGGEGDEHDASTSDHPKAARWLKQNQITDEMLDLCFHLEEDSPEVVGEVPGKTKKERTANCYLLCGAAALLKSGEATFDDAVARALCEHVGCLDPTNHAKYMKFGNTVSGDKKRGWKLLGPGLTAAANLVKAMAEKPAD